MCVCVCGLQHRYPQAAHNSVMYVYTHTHTFPLGFWSERTEVHKAAYHGQTSQLQNLIQSGASVNIVAVDSITPLHEAAIRGQTQCVRLLLDAGAQVRVCWEKTVTCYFACSANPITASHLII